MDITPIPIIVASIKAGEIIKANQSFLKTFQYLTCEDFIGKTMDQICLWANKNVEKSIFDEVKEKGIVKDRDVCLLDRSGKKHFLVLSAKTCDINPEYCLMAGIDVTQSRLSHEKYKILVESTKTPFIILNSKLEIIDFNDELIDLLFKNEESYQVQGCAISDLILGDDKHIVNKILNNLLTGNASVQEFEIALGKNIPTWLNITASLFENGEKKIFCIAKDISYKKKQDLRKFIEKQKKKDCLRQTIIEFKSDINAISAAIRPEKPEKPENNDKGTI